MAVIEAEGLTKHYGAVRALEGLDLEVEEGDVFGYLGPNGSGKTTTIRLLLGLIRPTSGRVAVLGGDPERDAVSIHRDLAYVPGEAALWPELTGTETLHLLARLQGTVDEDYRTELIDRFELDGSKRVRAYSKGNRQKVSLIAALAARPALLVLDEPTAGLDPLMEQVFRACVSEAKERGQTVFLSSHVLAEVEALCDRVAILRAGRLVEVGSLDSLRLGSTLSIEATFRDRPAPDVRAVPGVLDASVDGRTVRCRVDGPVAPLLAVLAAAGAERVVSREPSLEELFLTYYTEDDVPHGPPSGRRRAP
ncbi:ABC transporter ATP-binding protein [Actinotalea sp.]|uniref:ABC transporter ATP-binding protein n=1 Tax=Actinotalea sp. TaxID=1872145 RepID=UPI003564C175